MGVGIGIALGSAALGIFEGHEQKKASENAIEQQRINARAVADQRRIKEDEKMSSITSSNLASQAASPFAESSGSFSAIAEGNIEQFAEDRSITKLNLANQMQAFDAEDKQASTREIFGDVNSVFSAASSYYQESQLTKMVSANNKKTSAGNEKPWYDIWD